MNRFRIALIAGLAALTLGVIGVPAAAASNGSAASSKATSSTALDTIHVKGVTKSGKKFRGRYAIQRFVVQSHKTYAVGTLTGTLAGQHVTRSHVMMPAKLTGPNASGASASQAACTVLHLQLGPIDLNLLGLHVQLFGGTNPAAPLPITLLITAVPGNGNLLGNLLCNLTNALNNSSLLSQLNGHPQQLAAVLTSLVSLLRLAG